MAYNIKQSLVFLFQKIKCVLVTRCNILGRKLCTDGRPHKWITRPQNMMRSESNVRVMSNEVNVIQMFIHYG